MATPDIPSKCEDCVNIKSVGDRMVGTDDTGGGPEEFFTCSKGWNLERLWSRVVRGMEHDCDEYDDGYD